MTRERDTRSFATAAVTSAKPRWTGRWERTAGCVRAARGYSQIIAPHPVCAAMNRRTVLSILPALSLIYLGVLHSRGAGAAWPGEDEADTYGRDADEGRQSSGWPVPAPSGAGGRGMELGAIQGCSLHGQGFNRGEIESLLAPAHLVPQGLQAKAEQFNEVLGNIYELQPGMAFILDGNYPNAFATPENVLSDSKDGSILLGLNLFLSEFQNGPMTWEGAAVLIHAHEFGHIAEYRFGYTGPVPLMELQADALAGCAMAHQFMVDPARAMTAYQRLQEFEHASRSVFSKGSYSFNDPNFHGTPAQRLLAFRAGFQYVAGVNRSRGIQQAMRETRMLAERILNGNV